jgi:hypothetical protein
LAVSPVKRPVEGLSPFLRFALDLSHPLLK